MQRIGSRARRCNRRSLVNNVRQRFNFSVGGQHDDYWAGPPDEGTKASAEHQSTQASSAQSVPSFNEGRLVAPGEGYGPGRMPRGAAYDPSGTSDGNNGRPPVYNPFSSASNRGDFIPRPEVFNMQSSMHLSPVKTVDVRIFKGTVLVDIRQYTKSFNGDNVPTKKGISLTIAQWKRLQDAMGDIDAKIQEIEGPDDAQWTEG